MKEQQKGKSLLFGSIVLQQGNNWGSSYTGASDFRPNRRRADNRANSRKNNKEFWEEGRLRNFRQGKGSANRSGSDAR